MYEHGSVPIFAEKAIRFDLRATACLVFLEVALDNMDYDLFESTLHATHSKHSCDSCFNQPEEQHNSIL